MPQPDTERDPEPVSSNVHVNVDPPILLSTFQ
jgi:hypothetical protein